MKNINHELVYPGTSVAEVVQMLATPAFREAVCAYQRTIRSTATITPEGTGLAGRHVVLDYHHGDEYVPSFAKKFIGSEIQIVQTEDWSSDTRGDITVTIPGKPGDMRGTASIAQVGDDVVETVDLNVKVNIPLVGGKIEDLIAGLLGKGLKAENKVGLKWLAGEPLGRTD